MNLTAKRRIQIKKGWIQKPNGKSKLETTNPISKQQIQNENGELKSSF